MCSGGRTRELAVAVVARLVGLAEPLGLLAVPRGVAHDAVADHHEVVGELVDQLSELDRAGLARRGV